MANEITSTTTTYDREKFLAAKLLMRTQYKLVAASIAEKVKQPQGSGKTAYFVRYTRMYLPMETLTEGVTPANSTIALEEINAVPDQWGDVVTITDVAKLTTKHPLVKIATDLLSDNAQRVIDREIQIVMMAGTNVQYGDGSVTTRATITTAMTMSDTILHQARITLGSPQSGAGGAPPRFGPSNMKENATGQAATGSLLGGSHYLAVCGMQVSADIMKMAASTGLWSSVAQYQNAKAIYNGEVGTYLGFRWVETNFIPEFRRLGNTTAAVSSAASNGGGITGFTITAVNSPSGGTLKSSTTYYWKVTRKNLLRGFEEAISIAHSTATAATGDDEAFDFAFPATAGYVYNLYFDKTVDGGAGTDATLGLVEENIAAGATVRVLTEATSSTTAPANNNTTGPVDAVFPVYLIGDGWLGWVGLQDLRTYVTGDGATKDDPLAQRSTIGYKFMAKAIILNQLHGLRLEVASAFD